ncbi:MAG: sulfatase, partial [Truepera sp.]|nr:sulfatase [Truepera sp.]
MTRPNILFIMSDDHAAHALGCYGSRINRTPQIDRIATGGMRFDNCFCTNSICTPSRATILTGTYSHVNGVTTLDTPMDNRLQTFPKLLRQDGYQTAIVGKWHLGQGPEHWPTGFDYWNILPGQGRYHDPVMIEQGREQVVSGYATDRITDFSLQWLQDRDPDRPFLLMCHHKAPHRPWEPSEAHAQLYRDEEIPYPATFDDDYRGRAGAAVAAMMRVERDFIAEDVKVVPPDPTAPSARLIPPQGGRLSLTPIAGGPIEFDSPAERKRWLYQRYIKDYLRCVASLDDGVGRLLDFLEEEGIVEETVVVYTSDQGFFLGDHGWYDKRFMYEESLRMPFVIRYPREIEPGSVHEGMILNVDFPETFLDLAGVEVPTDMQGRSFRPLLQGERPADWREALYYRYWMHGAHHNVWAHYGLRTHRHKLIYYYADPLGTAGSVGEPEEPEWELFDLSADPGELRNLYHDPAYSALAADLTAELHRLQQEVGDVPYTGGEASHP